MKKLILASTSKYRKQLLGKLHWPFESMAPEVDESLYKDQFESPKALSEQLSILKAQAILKKMPQGVVIGSDQVCTFNNLIFSKPESFENAFKQLEKLSGEQHQLLTSVTIASSDKSYTWTNTTTLHMRSLSSNDIKRYLEIDEPYDCAGSYKLESMGIKLFEKIEMSDHTAIIGLPLIDITNVLIKNFGFEF